MKTKTNECGYCVTVEDPTCPYHNPQKDKPVKAPWLTNGFWTNEEIAYHECEVEEDTFFAELALGIYLERVGISDFLRSTTKHGHPTYDVDVKVENFLKSNYGKPTPQGKLTYGQLIAKTKVDPKKLTQHHMPREWRTHVQRIVLRLKVNDLVRQYNEGGSWSHELTGNALFTPYNICPDYSPSRTEGERHLGYITFEQSGVVEVFHPQYASYDESVSFGLVWANDYTVTDGDIRGLKRLVNILVREFYTDVERYLCPVCRVQSADSFLECDNPFCDER